MFEFYFHANMQCVIKNTEIGNTECENFSFKNLNNLYLKNKYKSILILLVLIL